jgi:hypothetical protein
MNDTYAKVSARIDTEWYPFHRDEWFTLQDICSYFMWNEQATRRQVTRKLYHDYKERKEPLLDKLGKTYRLIDDIAEDIDWQNADTSKPINLVLPFNIHKYVKLFPKSIICIAGEPNSGKSAFLLNTLLKNLDKDWVFYNSETSREQLKERFDNFNIEIPNPAPFKVKERYENFSDVLRPDGYTIIDYIDADVDFFNIGAEISRIHKKLTTGICVCAIQKKPGIKNFNGKIVDSGMGYGGALTLKRPSLYITMTTQNILTIKKGKSWVDSKINPNGMMWQYKLVNGADFHYDRIEEDY